MLSPDEHFGLPEGVDSFFVEHLVKFAIEPLVRALMFSSTLIADRSLAVSGLSLNNANVPQGEQLNLGSVGKGATAVLIVDSRATILRNFEYNAGR